MRWLLQIATIQTFFAIFFFFAELCNKKIIVKKNEKELKVYFKQMKR